MNLGLTDTHYHIQNRQTTKIYLQHLLSHFSHVQLCAATLWTVAHQVPLSMGFSRQEYWSGLPCPSPGDLPNPGIQPTSFMSPALAGRFFTTNATWEAPYIYLYMPYILTYPLCTNSTGNYIQYLVTNYNKKELKKKYIYIRITLPNEMKLTRCCHSTILQ